MTVVPYCLLSSLVLAQAPVERRGGSDPTFPLRTPERKKTDEDYRLNLKVHLSLAGAALVAWAGVEITKWKAGPLSCRWCDTDHRGIDKLNRTDRFFQDALYFGKPKVADWLSYGLGFGLVPVTAGVAVFLSAFYESSPQKLKWRRFLEDLALMMEVGAINSLAYQTIALSVQRSRPDAHLHAGRARHTDNVAFPSGHTAFAMSISVAAGTILTLRGSKLAPHVWAPGIVLSLLVGYFRIAARKHHMTDVLAGSALGALSGFLIPYLSVRYTRVPRIGLAASQKSAAAAVGFDF